MRKHPPFGLKVWSTNEAYVEEIVRLFHDGIMDYVEVYVVPGTGRETVGIWQRLHRECELPMIVHAPHYSHGMCLACSERKERNRELVEESLLFADGIEASMVIVHPGVNGRIEETARQLKLFWDDRLVLENKPRYGHGENLICNGATPEEIRFVQEETGVRFCLDIGHALTAANGFGVPWREFLEAFFACEPSLLHITDGHVDSLLDEHLHFGEGNFPIEEIVGMVVKHNLGGIPVTNEAYKKSEVSLEDFGVDMAYLARVYESQMP